MPVFIVGIPQVTLAPNVAVNPPIAAGQRHFTLAVTDAAGHQVGFGEILVTVPQGRSAGPGIGLSPVNIVGSPSSTPFPSTVSALQAKSLDMSVETADTSVRATKGAKRAGSQKAVKTDASKALRKTPVKAADEEPGASKAVRKSPAKKAAAGKSGPRRKK